MSHPSPSHPVPAKPLLVHLVTLKSRQLQLHAGLATDCAGHSFSKPLAKLVLCLLRHSTVAISQAKQPAQLVNQQRHQWRAF